MSRISRIRRSDLPSTTTEAIRGISDPLSFTQRQVCPSSRSDIVKLTSLSLEHILTPDKATSTLQIQDCIRLLELQKAIQCGNDSDTWYDDSCYETWFTARVLRKLCKLTAAYR